MPRGKRKHTSKLIDDEPFYEPPVNKYKLNRYYFKCETEIGNCIFVYSAYTLDQAFKKLYREVNNIKGVKFVKEKITH